MSTPIKNILSGIASIASIMPHTEIPKLDPSKYRANSDTEALYNDWYKIGQDMQRASTAYFQA